MSKKRIFVITSEDDKGDEQIDTIVHKDGADSLKHNNENKTGEKKTPPIDVGKKNWLLTNPQYWYKDSGGNWRCYCWGGSTC